MDDDWGYPHDLGNLHIPGKKKKRQRNTCDVIEIRALKTAFRVTGA